MSETGVPLGIAFFLRSERGDKLAGLTVVLAILVADGNHARVDGFVSLGVIEGAITFALGYPIGDPIFGLAITLVILKVTWDSWRTISDGLDRR